MKIAQVAPLYEAVPPQHYGGTERVIAALCDGLVEMGHDVTLFAARGSQTRASLRAFAAAPLRSRMGRQELIEVAPHLHLKMLADLYRTADFDIVHAHTDIWTLPFAEFAEMPTVITLHGRLDIPMIPEVLPMYPHAALVSISNSQRAAVDGLRLNWRATVHHGLDLRRYLDEPRPGGAHFAFIGRISSEKRVDLAIEMARHAGRELRIAAKVDPLDVEYFESHIEPILGSDTPFLGEIDEQAKPAFLAGAAATLFPVDWPEPFGLVMIESLAAGTPVIALERGSVPEVLIDGVTGFICKNEDELMKAVDRVGEIDPDDCRRRALQFDRTTMCEKYVSVYQSLVKESLQKRRPVSF